jgi:hypothetical protein
MTTNKPWGRPSFFVVCLPATAGTKPGSQSGFAMLFVFVLAAIIAIGLYEQLPRAAFEAQREKEQLLIDHGEQYIRGVQLYVRKLGKYPAKIEDLDNTQNIRFLRKHYIDPMTGKDEWRLLHMGPAGKLIDSKIKKDDPNKKEWNNQSITEFKAAGYGDDSGSEAVNIATRKRPSDDQAPTTMPGATAAPTQTASNGLPGMTPGGGLPGMPPIPGQPGAAANNAANANNANNANNSASQSSVSGNGGFGSSVSGNGGYAATSTTPTQAQNAAAGAPPTGTQSPYPTNPAQYQPNTANFGQPGQQTTAANMINNLLTSPRPGGAPAGVMGNGVSTIGGGLAGVASTYKGKGVKRYNDQEDYDKWEFYYDLSKEVAAQTPGAAAATNPNQQQQQNPNQMTPFGSQSSQGSGFIFGNNSNSGTQPAAPPAPPPPPTQ